MPPHFSRPGKTAEGELARSLKAFIAKRKRGGAAASCGELPFPLLTSSASSVGWSDSMDPQREAALTSPSRRRCRLCRRRPGRGTCARTCRDGRTRQRPTPGAVANRDAGNALVAARRLLDALVFAHLHEPVHPTPAAGQKNISVGGRAAAKGAGVPRKPQAHATLAAEGGPAGRVDWRESDAAVRNDRLRSVNAKGR